MNTSPTTAPKVEDSLRFPPPVGVEESLLNAALEKIDLKSDVYWAANTAWLAASSVLVRHDDLSSSVIASVIQVGDQFAPALLFLGANANVRIVARSDGSPAGFIFDRTITNGSSEMTVLPGQLKFYDFEKRTAEVVKGL